MVVESIRTGECFPLQISEERPQSLTATGLLEKGEYESLMKLLQETQLKAEEVGDTALVGVLAAAQQICLACHQFSAEKRSYKQAHEEAIDRERQLQRHLQIILKSINQPATVQRNVPVVSLSPVQSKLKFPERNTLAPVTHLDLRRHIQSLFDHKSSRSVVAREIPEGHIGEEPHSSSGPSLTVYSLGVFQVFEDEHPISEWSSRKGKSILKYLLLHRHRPITKEVLMELFWPDSDPDAARNNLNVAIYGLRQALRNGYPDFSHVLFQDDSYLLNPQLSIWLDVEEFGKRFNAAQELERKGQFLPAITEYQAAEALYQGELFEEDRYEDWLTTERQRLQNAYLSVLDKLSAYYYDNKEYAACVNLCHKMIAIEPYREDAYRRLMSAYARQGHHYLAMRQYHQCVETLKEELDVAPDPTTTQLYERIRRRETL